MPALKTVSCLTWALIALQAAAADDPTDSSPRAGRSQPFDHYQVIIDRMPFGAMASGVQSEADTPEDMQFVAAEEVQQLAAKLTMCAMSIMPDGRYAVGIIDSSVTPAVSHILSQGDGPVEGITLDLVDIESKVATFSKDGITFSLKLGVGIVETLTEETLAEEQRKREEEAAALAAAKPRPNTLAEQLLRMQTSVPPDVEAPPLPIIQGDMASLTKPFDPDQEKKEPEDEHDEIVQQGLEELKASVKAGETPQQYFERLQAHNREEARRQQAEKRAAAELEKELAKNLETEQERADLRRRINIELLKKGVVPLDNENIILTPEEEKELVNAGVLPAQ